MAKSKRETSSTDATLSPRIAELSRSINQKFGEGALMSLGSGPERGVDVIPTGSLALDRALGTGGYPRGRIVEIFGPESSGKTTLTLHAIAEVQAAGGTAAFIDAEHAFDARYAQALGVDLGRLLVAQPDCGEQGLDIAGTLVESGAIDLVVVDSVAALVPRAEIEGEMGDQHMGLHARLMGRGVRKLTADASRTKTCVIFINQLRLKIGVVFGNPETTTGGNALRFFSSVRLDVRRIGKATAGETTVGNQTRVKVVKNKLAPPFEEAEFDVRWGVGIDKLGELLDLGVEARVVERAGAHLSFAGVTLGQGRERARQALEERPELRQQLLMALLATDTEAAPGGGLAA
ncbi:MAG TPA: recombinase RecA [Polyangiaceae bacterium]|nr:recombinase RecA [Polyangiaceae bacterium]